MPRPTLSSAMNDIDDKSTTTRRTRTSSLGTLSTEGSRDGFSCRRSDASLALRKYIWDKFAEDDFDDKDDALDYEEAAEDGWVPTCRNATGLCLSGMWRDMSHYFGAIQKRPAILLVFLFVFAVVTACGMVALSIAEQAQRNDMVHRATFQALENGQWFAEQWARVLLPLYSLQQAVMHSPYFAHLSSAIGERDVPGSAPSYTRGEKFYRNTTGICDDPDLQQKFSDMVEQIRVNSGLTPDEEGIIVSYRLAPHAVFCYIDPLQNYRDFQSQGDGVFFDSRGAVGWDVLYEHTERWYQTVRETIGVPDNPISIYGPHDSVQNGMTVIPTLYCGHLSVNMPGMELRMDGKLYNSWGFVMVFMHFDRLIDRSGIHERFHRQGMQFQMTRTDTLKNATTGEYYEKVNLIANSDRAHLLTDGNSIEVPFDTPNGVWVNRVGYESGFQPAWTPWARLGVVVFAFAFSLMFAVVLVEKHLHRKLLLGMLPPRVLKKVQKGRTVVERYNIVTTYFSDIVGYTTMSAQMSPIQVMRMLNEFYVELDKIAERHGVYKVETIGDAYMALGGAPDRCTGPEGAERVALFALDVMDLVRNHRTPEGAQLLVRSGMNSGPVVAGVVGTTRPQYTVYGDSVNTASRMESTSKTMRIQCSDMTCRLLRDAPTYTFNLEERGAVDVKGKGRMNTWFINGATRGRKTVLEDTVADRTLRDDGIGTGEEKPDTSSFAMSANAQYQGNVIQSLPDASEEANLHDSHLEQEPNHSSKHADEDDDDEEVAMHNEEWETRRSSISSTSSEANSYYRWLYRQQAMQVHEWMYRQAMHSSAGGTGGHGHDGAQRTTNESGYE